MAESNQNTSGATNVEDVVSTVSSQDAASGLGPCVLPNGELAEAGFVPIEIGKPGAGEALDVLVLPGQKYFFTFEEGDVQNFTQQGGDLVLSFEDGSTITLRNFGEATTSDLPATVAFSQILDGSEFVSFEGVVDTVPADSELEEPQGDVREAVAEAQELVLNEAQDPSAEDLNAIEAAAGEEVLAEELAQIEPAAGEVTGAAGSQGNSGFGFQSSFDAQGVVPLADVGPIDPTALSFSLPQVQTNQLPIPDDQPEVLSPDPLSLDETNLGPHSVSGTVVADFGNDGPGTITPEGTFSASGSLTGGALSSNGNAITVTATGNGYVGTINGGVDTVFDLVINPSTGAYTFTQYLPLDHADGANPDDIATLNFDVVATDDDGDQSFTTIQINVVDDAPTIADDSGAVSEENIVDVVNGNLNPDFGSDGDGSITPNGVTSVNGVTVLTSGGDAVTITQTADGYEGTTNGGATNIFTVTIDALTGDYAFTLNGPIDHAIGSDVVTLNFGADITDF
ncbi:MAG: DUF5801 repeats-in-toxin domain-containing protein, partial [Alphaproteobacteria bacterium]